ncbi:unnamed protein product [Boreogadus saida]
MNGSLYEPDASLGSSLEPDASQVAKDMWPASDSNPEHHIYEVEFPTPQSTPTKRHGVEQLPPQSFGLSSALFTVKPPISLQEGHEIGHHLLAFILHDPQCGKHQM